MLIRTSLFKNNNTRSALIGFIIAYVLFSLLTFRDYGITWDETDSYKDGEVYFNHYFLPSHKDNLTDLSNVNEAACHNYIYTAFLRAIYHPIIYKRHLFNYEELHLLNMLFGIFVFIAIYEVLFSIYKKTLYGLLGCFFLLLTPRFLGDLPANPSDMPFAVLYFLSLTAIYLIPEKIKNVSIQIFIIGSLIGFTSCTRILGLTLIPILVMFRFFEYFRKRNKEIKFFSWILNSIIQLGSVFIISQLWMMLLWPYLGRYYFSGYQTIFEATSKFSWDGWILFMGKWVHSLELPLSYLPVWICITTPIFIMVFFLFSFFIRNEKVFLFWSLLITAFGFNFFIYFALKPVIYNGLRHFLFLLPIISVSSSIGFIEFFRGTFPPVVKKTGIVFVVLNILWVLVDVIRLYPYPYVYFNELIGGLPGAYGKYETDYWGASLKESTEWLVTHEIKDPNKTYRIKTSAGIYQSDYYFLKNMKGNLHMKNADYAVEVAGISDDFILTPETENKIIHTTQREGVPLSYVLKLK